METRSYLIEGELGVAEWDSLVILLGALGVCATEIAEKVPEEIKFHTNTLPYALDQIQSPGQFVSYEHAEEYWAEYQRAEKHSGRSSLNKAEVLHGSFSALLDLRPRAARTPLNSTSRGAYAKSLGLDLTEPRAKVGFPTNYSPACYMSTNINPAVAEVASFINFATYLSDVSPMERPRGLGAAQTKFLQALAGRLCEQIGIPAASES